MASNSPSTPARHTALLSTTSRFCAALTVSPPPSPKDLLSRFFVPGTPRVTEHGPAWAAERLPFLGKTFEGVDGCLTYFDLLSQILDMSMDEGTFPGEKGFVVDAEAKVEGVERKGVVNVVGKAWFKSKKTKNGWHEHFIYRFSDFDADGKIGHWEIWADPLSAWVAVGDEVIDQDRELE